MVERESGKRVKAIRSDRGGEFLGAEFRSWLKRHGIKQQLTMASTPESNGVAERANRTIIEGGRTIFVDSCLPLRFWPLAIHHATVIKNRVLTHVGGHHWVPMEKWSGKKPLVDIVRVFVCMGLVHVPKEKCDKLQVVAVWAFHLCLAWGSKGWLMWDPKSNTIFTTRDAKFMEGLMFKELSERGRSKVTIPLGIEVGTNDPLLIPIELSSSSGLTEVSNDLGGAEGEAENMEGVVQQGEAPIAKRGDTEEEVQLPTPSPKLPPRRTTQGKCDDVRGGAKEGAAKERPKKAAHPRDFLKKALDGTWVLRVKTDADGKLERRKTRLVIKGFQQTEGIDFQEVFAPNAKVPTLRVLLAAAAVCGRKVEKMDVKTAFLYGMVDEDEERTCLQAQQGHLWPQTSSKGEEEKVFLLVYVDGILLFSPSLERIKEVQGNLKETFPCKALGSVGYYPGLHVERDEVKGWLRLHQNKYLATMGEKYGLEEWRSANTPLPSGFQLHLDEEEGEVLEYELQHRFHSMLGSLIYTSVNTRPNIAFSVSQLAREVSRPLQEHLDAAERLVSDFMATSRVGLQYSVHGQLKQKGVEEVSTKTSALARRGHLYLSCNTDATWASDISDATSHGGYICCVGGIPVSWKSKKQGEIAHSSTESEYMVLFHGVKEVVWMKRLLEELGQEHEARVSGQGRERYFLLVVDDYTRYTTVFPLRSKGEVSDVLIPWIRTVRLQLRERFGQDLPVLRLHSDRGGEFSSVLLRDFCRGEGILQSFTLPDSPQQNGIAERRIGLVMEVARTSMIHAAAPHFLWPFAVRYDVHQLNLWPRVSLPETSPTLCWTGKVGDASVFRFYHPTSRRVLLSQDVTFDESVPFYCLFPFRSASPSPPPLFLAPGPPQVDPLLPQGPTPSGVSQVDPLSATAPVQVAIVSGAAPDAASGGAASGGAAFGGAEPGGAGSEGAGSRGAEPVGAEPEGVEPGGAESEGAESRGAEPQGAASSGGPAAPKAGGAGDTGAGGAAVTTGAGGTGGTLATGPGSARTSGAGVAGTGGARAAGAGAVDPEAGGARETEQPRPYFVPLLQQVLGVRPSTGLPPPFLCPPPDQSQPPLQPASPLPAPSPYTEQSGGLTERRKPVSRPVLPVCTARRAPRSRPPPVPSTHTVALRPSSVPLRVSLPAPPGSSLPEVPDPASDQARTATPTIAHLLANAVTDPSFESAATSALVAELLDFVAACRLDYATALVAESMSASPPSVGGECALGTDVLEDRQEDFECLAATVPRLASLLLAPEGDPDAPDIPTPRSYAEAITVPPSRVNIVDGMWIFRGVDYFQTFSTTPKMTTLRVLLHVAAQRDYELHSLDFSTAFLQGSLHEEIWLPRPPGFTGTFPAGTQWSLRRPVYGLRQAPREWHDTLRTTLAALGFAPSIADPSLSSSRTRTTAAHALAAAQLAISTAAPAEAVPSVAATAGTAAATGTTAVAGSAAGLSVPQPPLFLDPTPPSPAPLVHPSHSDPAPSVDSRGVGAGGTGAGGAGFEGVGARDTGAGGAGPEGARAGGAGTGGSSSGDAGASGTGTGGASFEGAGAGGDDVGGARAVGIGTGGASFQKVGVGGFASTAPTPPPHCYPTRFQALHQLEHEEQGQLQRKQQQQSHQPSPLQQLYPPVSGLWALGLPSSPPDHSPPPIVHGLPPPDAPPAVFHPVVPHTWATHCPPRARPSSPVTDLHSILFCSSPPRSPPPSVCSSLIAFSSHPIADYYRTSRPVLSRLLTSLVKDPRASPSSVSAFTAVVADFATTRCLDYATHVVAAAPTRPLSTGDEFQFSTTQPTPLAVDHRLTGPFLNEPFESSGPYIALVGYLMYLMTCTLPDLAFPLSVLSRFVATGRHRPDHWTAAVRLAKYLATTSGMGLVLGGTQPVELTGYCDSSYADDVETQQAEIYAGAMAAQEFRWLTFLLTDLGERPRSAPTLYADNKAMILQCCEPRLESRVKHIDVRYFLLRELQRRGQAHFDFVASEANTADVFTKALAPSDYHMFCVQLGLVEAGPQLL
ncbi:unnamed protein product [Closterium sp. NIES-53]